MILCRMHHDVIDCPNKEKTAQFYLKNKKTINKYNSFLMRKKFDKEHYWRLSNDREKVALVDYLNKEKLLDIISINILNSVLNL